MRFINLYIAYFISCLIILISCNDKEDNNEIIGPNIFLVEIKDQPDIPDIYTQSLITPKVSVRNEGMTNIDTLDISYFVMMVDSVETKEIGPSTQWTTTIKPGDEIVIELNQWDTINGNTPLIDGTYVIEAWLSRYIPSNRTRKEKNFILEL